MKTHRMFLTAIVRPQSLAASVVLLALVLATAASHAPVVHAATITVNSTDDTTISGDGKCTLREALINADNDAASWPDCAAGDGADIINITATGTILLSSELPAIWGGLTIIGPGRSNLSLDGQSAHRILMAFCSLACSINISDLTIQNAKGDNSPAIYVANANVALSHVIVQNNTMSAGSESEPMSCNADALQTMTLNDVIIRYNSAPAGHAGAFHSMDCLLSLNNVTFESNTSSGNPSAGALYLAGAATLNNVTFSNNSTAGSGGAIFNVGIITVTNSVFTNNSTTTPAPSGFGFGGAVENHGGQATFTNVTFYQNSSTNPGSAIFAGSGSTTTVVNSTIADNTGSMQAISGYSDITLKNTIVSNNPPGNCGMLSGNAVDGGGNLTWPDMDDVCPGTLADPKLDALADNGGAVLTRALLDGSPAINGGSATVCAGAVGAPTFGAGGVDARGQPRRAGFCDSGAFEAQPAAVSTTAGSSPQSAILTTAFAHALGVKAADAHANGLGGVTVTYSAPASGASAALSATTATSNASGDASVTATANGLLGSYSVTASATGATPATFNLTNTPRTTTTTITSHLPHPSRPGQAVTVLYTVTSTYGTPTGNVTVSDGAVNCVGTVAAGNCTMTFTSPGSKTLTAAYAGDGGFGSSTSSSHTHAVNWGTNLPLLIRP